MKDKQIKLLYFCPFYAPYNEVGSYRVTKFSKFLAKNNIKQYIFTANFNTNINANLYNDIPKTAEIFRKNINIPEIKSLSAVNKKKGLLNSLKFLIKDLLFSPDKYIWWSLAYLPKMIKLIKKEKIDIIMACGDPFSTFVTAYFVKKICGIPLIIDFRDPWKNHLINLKQSFIRRFFDAFWEKRCVLSADLIISVTEQIVNDLRKYKSKGKVIKLSNGFDIDDFSHLKNVPEKQTDNELIILYTGKYSIKYQDYNPDKVIEIFLKFKNKNDLDNVKLIFVGKTDQETLDMYKNISEKVVFHQLLPRDKVIAMQKDADILLHYHYPMVRENAISVKMYEYALCGKPIISLNTCKGDLFNFLKENQFGETADIYDEKQSINLFEKAVNKQIKICNDPYNQLQKYDFKNITSTLIENLKELTGKTI